MTVGESRAADVIDVRIESAEWPGRIGARSPAGLVEEAVAATLARCGPDQPVEVSVVLAGADTVRALNRDYRGRDASTNVLAFALHHDASTVTGPPGAPLPLGDVVLAGGVCADEAAAQGKPLADHMRHLAVHGVLHLLGHDHAVAAEADAMEGLERAVLGGLGIADPYDAAAVA
jgi:probable rRNA maturation factor